MRTRCQSSCILYVDMRWNSWRFGYTNISTFIHNIRNTLKIEISPRKKKKRMGKKLKEHNKKKNNNNGCLSWLWFCIILFTERCSRFSQFSHHLTNHCVCYSCVYDSWWDCIIYRFFNSRKRRSSLFCLWYKLSWASWARFGQFIGVKCDFYDLFFFCLVFVFQTLVLFLVMRKFSNSFRTHRKLKADSIWPLNCSNIYAADKRNQMTEI